MNHDHSLWVRVTLSKSINCLVVAFGVSLEETMWALGQRWGDVESTLRSSLTPHSTILSPAGSTPQQLSGPLSLPQQGPSPLIRSKVSLLVRRKCWAFIPGLLSPKPKQEPGLFSVNTHLLSARKRRILFIIGSIFSVMPYPWNANADQAGATIDW